MVHTVQDGLTNMGKPWKQDELDQLLNEIKEKKSYTEIADIHKRTKGGIISRLRVIAAELHLNDKRSIQDCIKITGLDMTEVIDAIDKRELNNRIKAKNLELRANAKLQALSKHVDPVSERNIVSKHVDPLHELRIELNEVKKDVKEILRLMNALYDFEASQS